MKENSNHIVRKLVSLGCMAASLCLMASPGISMRLADGPGRHRMEQYPYFSPMPFGYGNWFPSLATILTILAIALLVLSFWKAFPTVIAIVTLGAIACTGCSWLLFESITPVSVAIMILQAVVVGILIESMRIQKW